MRRIFITFAEADSSFVDRLIRDVSLSTVNVIPEKIRLNHDDTLYKLLDQGKRTGIFVPVISDSSASDNWARNDVPEMLRNGIVKLVPVVKSENLVQFEDQLPKQLSETLRHASLVEFSKDNFQTSIVKLLQLISPSSRDDAEEIYSIIEAPGSDNPFRRVRTEYYEDLELLARTFAEPETAEYDRIIEVKPTIIQGGRGSGKSMLLKSMEATVAAYRQSSGTFKNSNIQYFGVYCRLTQGSFATQEGNILKHVSLETATKLFTTELILQLTQSAIEEIRMCTSREILNISHDRESRFAQAISTQFNSSTKCDNLQNLKLQIQLQLGIINEYLGRRMLDESPIYGGLFLDKGQLREISKSILTGFPELSNATIYFLLDEYENLLPFQKVVINTLMKWSESRVFSIKIATKKTGFQNAATMEGQEIEEPADYSLIDLDYNLSKGQDRRNYIRLLRKVSNNILRNEKINQSIDKLLVKGPIAEGITEREIEHEVQIIAERLKRINWEKIPLKQQMEYMTKFRIAATYRLLGSHRRQFSGLYDFAFLSSGIIRHFLELCGMAYYFSRQDGVDIRKGDKIPPKYQSEAAFSLSSYYLATIRKNIANYGPIIQQFVIDLGDIFHYKLLYHPSNPEASRLSIVDPQSLLSPEMKVTDAIIKAAIMHSVLQTPAHGLGGIRPSGYNVPQPTDLILNRIYSPVLRYSPRARWATKIETTDLEGLLDGKRRGQVKSRLIRLFSGVEAAGARRTFVDQHQTTLFFPELSDTNGRSMFGTDKD